MPDHANRHDVLAALERKRPHLDGAALFAALHRRPQRALVRALVGYEAILEILDNMNERAQSAGVGNGLTLHLALRDAVKLDAPVARHLRWHPFRDDGGCVAALVAACRQSCGALPSYAVARSALVDQAQLAEVLALNHESEPRRREALLEQWARETRSPAPDMSRFEVAAAATASLTVHALLALAAEPDVNAAEVDRTAEAYPGISVLATMLDSYVDRAEDLSADLHSYVSYYRDAHSRARRLAELTVRAVEAAGTLRDGAAHAVLVSSMVALYMSSDHALGRQMRPTSALLTRAAGPLAVLLVPVLRGWRIAHGLRKA